MSHTSSCVATHFLMVLPAILFLQVIAVCFRPSRISTIMPHASCLKSQLVWLMLQCSFLTEWCRYYSSESEQSILRAFSSAQLTATGSCATPTRLSLFCFSRGRHKIRNGKIGEGEDHVRAKKLSVSVPLLGRAAQRLSWGTGSQR